MPYADKEAQRAYQRNWMKRRREAFFEGKSCVQCGDTEHLHLDHIDPSTKITHRIWSFSKKKRDAEKKARR